VNDYPNLLIGAKYHHERYDGKGYPDHLKGKEIPEIARIISVADAYDAMTSKRSYRDALPQHIVREELVKGTGTQFDPDFAENMIRLIDMDTEYRMRESVSDENTESS
jgi:HD-GYP domain-containing protein (c-di-GMP phosphodiesterase class II)